MTGADRDPQAPEEAVDLLPDASSGIPIVLKVAEVARMLRTGTNVVYRTIAAGELPAIRVGRSLRVTRAALVAFMKGERP